MRHWLNRALVPLAIAAVFFLGPRVVEAQPLAELAVEIDSWRLETARELATGLDETTRRAPEAQYLLGRLLFHEGDFKGALTHLREAIQGARSELRWKTLRDHCENTEAVYESFTKTEGESGRFVYRYKSGVDATLVPYAEDTLVRQLDALSAVLGDHPKSPIEIDILPDIETLALASGLTVDQIERTGAVGVTKYARIMIVSPKALGAGYPWLDTLAHELVHFVITRVSRNRAPIWLQEGIAKLYERLWRDGELGALTPEEAYLLDRAARERRLIPLRRFHPSVAHLPNQEDAALAYAQVLAFTKYLGGKLGSDWAGKLLHSLGEGNSLDQAFASLSRFDVKKLYNWWRQEAGGIRQTPVPAVSLLKRRYMRGHATGDKGLESDLSTEVRRHLRIGDLLRLRGHLRGAIKEYRQAAEFTESPTPEITDRLGACLLLTNQSEAAIELLRTMAELYPTHATVFVQLGRAHNLKGESENAIAALESANSLSPFDPMIHCTLKDLYQEVGRKEEAEMESANCRTLTASSTSR